jgi:hypothetical protein
MVLSYRPWRRPRTPVGDERSRRLRFGEAAHLQSSAMWLMLLWLLLFWINTDFTLRGGVFWGTTGTTGATFGCGGAGERRRQRWVVKVRGEIGCKPKTKCGRRKAGGGRQKAEGCGRTAESGGRWADGRVGGVIDEVIIAQMF